MKKALYIGGFTMPDGNAAAQRVLGIAKVLRECDFEVRFSGLHKNSTVLEHGSVDNFDYVNYPYPSSIVNWFRYLLGYDFAITEIRGYKPDLVILYNHPALAIERIAAYCRKSGIKVIADVTEWYDVAGNPIFKTIKGYDVNRRMKKSHAGLDGLICISRFLKDYYSSCDIPLVEIPPLVDITQSKWQQSAERDDNIIRIVYAGSPGGNKDRLDLIMAGLDMAVKEAGRNINFKVYGLTKQQYQEQWYDRTEREYVEFLGRIPHEAVIKYLLNADFQIFLRPDILQNRAGFPTKFVETITSGSLPVTNLSSNLEDYLTDNVNGIVIKSLEAEDVSEAITRAISKTPSELMAMRDSVSRNRFDYCNYIPALRQFLKACIK